MTARFSPDRVYRYTLERTLHEPTLLDDDEQERSCVLFVLLNPSTADETADDPTVRRCMGFGRSLGYGHLTVCNLFGLRSTDPQALRSHPDPVGPENDGHILEQAGLADRIVLAWGIHGALLNRDREVLDLLHTYELHVLGRTKDGMPQHPLYLPSGLVPIPAGEPLP